MPLRINLQAKCGVGPEWFVDLIWSLSNDNEDGDFYMLTQQKCIHDNNGNDNLRKQWANLTMTFD